MVFSSILFLFLFLPLTLAVYLLAGSRLRNLALLIASLIFYAWGEGLFVVLMLASIGMNYGFGLLVATGRRRGLCLAAAVGVNLALLGVFKYANFAVDNLNRLLAEPLHLDPVHLPIGISFFTFQALSYVIDVYRGQARAARNPLHVGVYISSFPQLVAGPIVRYTQVARQIVARHVGLEGFAYGVERFVYGLGKKVLIANTMGAAADRIFALPAAELGPVLAWLGAVSYTLQIYFDFSGYSDMAIGLGRMFGFRFPENFNYPYIADSIRDFWRRWHISLSTWFRDYLYIPLGGSRRGTLRTYANLVTVFFLVGLWHGASWTFVLWGLYHGAFLVIERLGFSRWLRCLWRPLRHGYVLIVVVVGWVLFRAESLSQAQAFLSCMAGSSPEPETLRPAALYFDRETVWTLAAGLLLATPAVRLWASRLTATALRAGSNVGGWLPAGLETGRALCLALIFCAAVLNLAAGVYNPFIYFRF